MEPADLQIVRDYLGIISGIDMVEAMEEPPHMKDWIAALHRDVVLRWQPELPDAETYHGPDGAIRAAEEWMESWDEFRMEPEEVIDAGDRAVVVFRQFGRGKGSGATVEMKVAQVYEVRDGSIASVLEYSSREEALAAAGRPVP